VTAGVIRGVIEKKKTMRGTGNIEVEAINGTTSYSYTLERAAPGRTSLRTIAPRNDWCTNATCPVSENQILQQTLRMSWDNFPIDEPGLNEPMALTE
jgi:hypothetical protein